MNWAQNTTDLCQNKSHKSILGIKVEMQNEVSIELKLSLSKPLCDAKTKFKLNSHSSTEAEKEHFKHKSSLNIQRIKKVPGGTSLLLVF